MEIALEIKQNIVDAVGRLRQNLSRCRKTARKIRKKKRLT